MEQHSSAHGDIEKHVKTYMLVFAALAALTIITVAISYLHLPIHYAVLVALTVATIKGALVAAYFMHLISERSIIFSILGITAFFFIVLLLLPVIS